MENNFRQTLPMLDMAYGVSGEEDSAGKAMKKAMEGLYDEYFEDVLGNHIFVKKGKEGGKKILLCGHLDEIGFIVYNILENGHVKVLPVGYHDDRVCVNQRLVIMGDKGEVSGITGSIPFHALDHTAELKPTKIKDLIIDVGTISREETRKLGVEIGNYVAFAAEGSFLNGGKVYSGKSVDDRSGCAVIVETFRAIQDMDLDVTVYGVGTVQEEVGMRGGGVIANRVQPDLMLAIDVTLSNDIAGMEECNPIGMGKGPCVKYYDWDPDFGMAGNNVPKKLTKMLCDTAAENNIPFQREVMTGGGTDAWTASLAGTGYLAGGISIPSQYIHTAVGTVHLDDLVNATKLIIQVLKKY